MADYTKYIPSKEAITSFGKSMFGVLTIFIVLLIVLTLGGIFCYWLVRNLKFNKKIVIFEKVGNNWEQTGRDRAIEMKYGLAGDTLFYLRKRKKYIPRPELQTGRRTYWFAIREDGEWINISMEDINLSMKQVKAKFLHPEMRYARTALLRNLRDRYEKPKFLEKYGVMMINIVAITIILLFMWLIIDKIISVGDKINMMIDTANKVMEKAGEVLTATNNICQTSGFKT